MHGDRFRIKVISFNPSYLVAMSKFTWESNASPFIPTSFSDAFSMQLHDMEDVTVPELHKLTQITLRHIRRTVMKIEKI